MSKSSAQRKPVTSRKPAPKAKAAKPAPKGPATVITMPVKKLSADECLKKDIPLTDPRHPLHRPIDAKPAPVSAGPAKPATVVSAPKATATVPALPAPKSAALSAVVASAPAFKIGDKVKVLVDDKPSKETFTLIAFEPDEPRPVSMKLIDAAQAALDYLKKAGPRDLTSKLEAALHAANSEWFAVNKDYAVHVSELVKA